MVISYHDEVMRSKMELLLKVKKFDILNNIKYLVNFN